MASITGLPTELFELVIEYLEFNEWTKLKYLDHETKNIIDSRKIRGVPVLEYIDDLRLSYDYKIPDTINYDDLKFLGLRRIGDRTCNSAGDWIDPNILSVLMSEDGIKALRKYKILTLDSFDCGSICNQAGRWIYRYVLELIVSKGGIRAIEEHIISLDDIGNDGFICNSTGQWIGYYTLMLLISENGIKAIQEHKISMREFKDGCVCDLNGVPIMYDELAKLLT